MRKFVLVLVGVAFLVAPAFADDITPPLWRDVQHPGTTLQQWEFNSAGEDIGGGVTLYYPDGTDVTQIWGNGVPPSGYTDPAALTENMSYNTGQLIASGAGGVITLEVPNIVDEEPFKLLRVQLTGEWSGSAEPDISLSEAKKGDQTAAWTEFVPQIFESSTGPDHMYRDFKIVPNPDWEVVQIEFGANQIVDQIIVDSLSIPEPATMSLLALGGLALLRRKRR